MAREPSAASPWAHHGHDSSTNLSSINAKKMPANEAAAAPPNRFRFMGGIVPPPPACGMCTVHRPGAWRFPAPTAALLPGPENRLEPLAGGFLGGDRSASSISKGPSRRGDCALAAMESRRVRELPCLLPFPEPVPIRQSNRH